MKKITYFFSVVIVLLITTNLNAQDKLFLKSGENIEAKILEVNLDEVEYKKFANLEGPTYTIVKSEIHMVIYENGESEIFKIKLSNDEINLNKSDENMFLKGQQDASFYYKGYRGAGTGTLLTSLLSPIVGLIPAIATSATKPNRNHLRFPDEKLMNNSDYFMGYTKKAKKIKQGRVWLNWGIGFGVNIIATAILLSAE
jgi:hypothetical protein